MEMFDENKKHLQIGAGQEAMNEKTNLLETSVGSKYPVLPEVPCFLYFVAFATQNLVCQFWLLDHFANEHQWKGAADADCCQNNTSPDDVNATNAAVETLIQSKTNQYIMYTNFVSSFTALFPTLCLGPMTDKFGRKFVLFISYLGIFLSMLFTTVVYYFNMSPNYLFASMLILGIGGSYGLFLTAVFGMVADVSPEDNRRGFRIATLEISIAIANSAGSVTSGIWVTKLGYLWPMVFSISLVLLASIYTTLLLPETLVQRRIPAFSIKDCVQFYTKDTADKRRFKLFVCLLCFVVSVWIGFGDINFFILYLLHQPFYWTKPHAAIFYGAFFFTKRLVAFIILVASRHSSSLQSVFALLGSLSIAGGCLIKGFAQSSAHIFFSAAVHLLSETVIPLCRTLMSKSVSSSEQGALFAGLGVFHMVTTAFTGIAMSGVYTAGLHFFLGLPYLVFAGLGFCDVILLTILIISQKKPPSVPDFAKETTLD